MSALRRPQGGLLHQYWKSTSSRLSNDLDLHLRNPAFDHADCVGGRIRQIDGSPRNIRTTVIDANRHGPSSLDVRDAQARAKWQCAVSGRQLIRIEFFAARCFRIVLVEARDTVGRRLRRRLRCRRDMLCRPCWCWMRIASGAPFRPVADNGRASASRKRRGRDSNRNYLRIDSTTAP